MEGEYMEGEGYYDNEEMDEHHDENPH